MKNLILLLSIITICYACKKESVEPSTFKSTQSTYDQCSDSGICSEGIYETGPNFLAGYDTILHELGSTTQFAQVKLTFIGYGPIIQGGNPGDTLMYKMSLANFDTTYMDMSSLKIIYQRRHQSTEVFGLKVKSGKWIIFRKTF
jgi:hypothetical protein